MKPVTTVWGSSSPETGLMLTSDQARFHCSLIALNARPAPKRLFVHDIGGEGDVSNLSDQV